MTATDKHNGCYLYALRLLTGRDYTSDRLVTKLRQRGFDSDEILKTVEHLTDYGYLDDRRYAERLVASAQESGRYVGYRLRQELVRRGISRDLAEELLQQDEPQDQLGLARQLVQQRYRSFDPAQADDRERRRIAGFLQRRGFEISTILNLLGFLTK